MPYGISENQSDCQGWATVKEEADGSFTTIGCHESKQDAIDQMVAVSIAEDMQPLGERKSDSNTVIIVDVDGTVLFGSDPIRKTIDYVNELGKTDFIHIVTGRMPEERDKTESDLRAAGLIFNALTVNDTELSSPEYKKQTAEKIGKTKTIKLAIDNDEKARAAYRSLGIETLNPTSINAGDTSRSQMSKKIERRTYTVRDIETRQAEDGTMRLSGYAAVFNDNSVPLPFVERIAPGAFRKTLTETPDVRLLINHEGLPLARTKNGTLTLREDDRGLYMDAVIADTQEGRDLYTLVQRGDLDQMSFAFRVIRQKWNETRTERLLTELSLADGDVSVVTYPAYPTTTVEARMHLQMAMEALTEGRALEGEALIAVQAIFDKISESSDYLEEGKSMLEVMLGLDTLVPAVEVEKPEVELTPASEVMPMASARKISLRLAQAIVNNTK